MTPFLHLNHVDVNQCQQLGFVITPIFVSMNTSLCINILANKMVWLPDFLAHIFFYLPITVGSCDGVATDVQKQARLPVVVVQCW